MHANYYLQGDQAFWDHHPYSPPRDLRNGDMSDWCRGWLDAARTTGLTQEEIEKIVERDMRNTHD